MSLHDPKRKPTHRGAILREDVLPALGLTQTEVLYEKRGPSPSSLRKADLGRDRDADEIVRLRRAAAVGRLMLGELDAPIELIRREDYVSKPRRELKAEVAALRESLQGELRKFCKRNFVDVNPERLAALYEDVLTHDSQYRLPLSEFIRQVGEPRSGVLKGAPAHATVHLSPWGLQTEYPELHLARDLALAYNDAFDAHRESQRHVGISWKSAKQRVTRDSLAAALRRGKYSMRMCLLSCFNLAEAYINGIAWEYVQSVGTVGLSNNQKEILTGDRASLLDKLVKVPAIVKGLDLGPLSKDQDSLLAFRELVKPFRDSIVHASPFSKPEHFGGYDKLQRIYELEMASTTTAVDLTLTIVSTIHEFLGPGSGQPSWIPSRADDGRFIID